MLCVFQSLKEEEEVEEEEEPMAAVEQVPQEPSSQWQGSSKGACLN